MSDPTKHPKNDLFGEGKVKDDIEITNLLPAIRKDINILVYETDPDIQYLYQEYMNVISPHVSCTVVDNIEKMINSNDGPVVYNFKSTQKSDFDTIILDVNVGDYDAIRIAKKLLHKLPRQKIVFTTTADLKIIEEDMIRQGLTSSIVILQKPFSFSDLLAIISPTKNKFDKLKLTDHVLASYNSIQDELMDAVEFIKKGIGSAELNLLLIRNDMDIQKTISDLKSKGLLNADTLIDEQSLVIIKNEKWYIPDGRVDIPRIMNQWQSLIDQSIQQKKTGLRAFCMMDCFFENGYSKQLVNYECNLPSQFQIPVFPLCAYRQIDLDCLTEKEKKKLIECHNHMIFCE
jgi:CheY-like chemotaxis protein